MLIQIALRETEKAENESNPLDGKTGYVKWNSDELWWYDRKTDNARRPLSHEEMFESYDPYHEVKKIRPEKAGELWQYNNLFVWCTVIKNEVLEMVCAHGKDIETVDKMNLTVHGKNGWKRLFPEVEDDSVERIEFDDMVFLEGLVAGSSVFFPTSNLGQFSNGIFKDYCKRPPIKMIFEIPKEGE